MPPASDASEMNRMYGNVMRSSCTVRSNLLGTAAKPGALRYTMSGAARIPSTLTTNRTSASRVAMCSTKMRVSASPRLDLILRQDRHEGLRKGAFGEDPPQQVGQLEGDEEGVGIQPGPERARDHDVAHESEDARDQRHAADGDQRLEQVQGRPLPSACMSVPAQPWRGLGELLAATDRAPALTPRGPCLAGAEPVSLRPFSKP